MESPNRIVYFINLFQFLKRITTATKLAANSWSAIYSFWRRVVTPFIIVIDCCLWANLLQHWRLNFPVIQYHIFAKIRKGHEDIYICHQVVCNTAKKRRKRVSLHCICWWSKNSKSLGNNLFFFDKLKLWKRLQIQTLLLAWKKRLWSRYILVQPLTSCQGTDSCPGSHGSKTKILTNGKFHVEQRNSVDCKHHKVWYQECCCKINRCD